MNSFEFLRPLLRCPDCHSPDLVETDKLSNLSCHSCGSSFPFSCGRPILLNHNNEVFTADDYKHAKPFAANSSNKIQRLIPSSSINLSRERVMIALAKSLSILNTPSVLVVGGGQQRQWLDDRLNAGNAIKVVYSDIDIEADVDVFCDGHELPFINAAFDAVITTAVLEHVLYPERVVEEIRRVLKPGGKIYSELPFIQQVHEGAYDFTRYSLSGHRRLLNGFSENESGMVAGPGTAMVWTIENFVLAFVSKPGLRKLSKAAVRITFWFKYLTCY